MLLFRPQNLHQPSPLTHAHQHQDIVCESLLNRFPHDDRIFHHHQRRYWWPMSCSLPTSCLEVREPGYWLLACSLKFPYLQKGVRDAHFYHMGSDPSLQKTVMMSVCLMLGLNTPQSPHQVIVCLSFCLCH